MPPRNMDINRDQTGEHHQNTDGLLQTTHAHFTPSTSVPDLELLQHRVKSDPTKVCTTPMLQLGKAAVVVDSVQGSLSANNQTNSNNEFHTHITGSSLMLPVGGAALATASSSTSDGTQILDSSGKRRTLTRDSPLHCDICGKKFTRNHQFKCHIMWHTGETPHKCNFCNILFSRKEHLKRHMTLHTGETPFRCNYCSKSFPRKDSMVSHERQHKKETPLLCPNSLKTSTKKCHLVKSIKPIADESLQESTYYLEKTKEKSPIHQNIVESPSQCPKTLSCEFCNHTYKCEEYFISNDLLSSKYNCIKCNNTMPINEQLFEHVTACHSQDYPHVCEVCKKLFKFKGQLWVHLEIHPTRTFECDICSKVFELKYHLVKHRHSHTNPKSSNFIPCNIYDKKKKK